MSAYFTQLWLLLRKEFLYLRRHYFWTAFELLIPAGLSLFLIHFIASTSPIVGGLEPSVPLIGELPQQFERRSLISKFYQKFQLHGGIDDFTNNLERLSNNSNYCQNMRKILVGSTPSVDETDLKQIVQDLNSRYSFNYCNYSALIELFLKALPNEVNQSDSGMGTRAEIAKTLKKITERIQQTSTCSSGLKVLSKYLSDNVTEFENYLSTKIRETKQLFNFVLPENDTNFIDALRNGALSKSMCSRNFSGGIFISTYNPFNSTLRYTLYVHDDFPFWHNNDEGWNYGRFNKDYLSGLSSTGKESIWSSGLLSIQYAFEDNFIKKVFKESGYHSRFNGSLNYSSFKLSLQRIPETISKNEMLSAAVASYKSLWPFLATFTIVCTVSTITHEKKSGMFVYLKLMGLRSSVYYASNAIISFLKLALIYFSGLYEWVDFSETGTIRVLIFTLLAYLICIISFSQLITAIIHKSHVPVRFTLCIWLASIFVVGWLEQLAQGAFNRSIAMLNANFAFFCALSAIEKHLDLGMEWSWSNCFSCPDFSKSFGIAFILLIFDAFVMFLLRIYLDAVFPSGKIPRENYFYFLDCFKSKLATSVYADYVGEEDNGNIQPDTHRDFEDPDVEVAHLVKDSGCFSVVNSVSLRAYENEVLVLLGHPGAGKSTTFMLLTGLLRPDSGLIKICQRQLGPFTLAQCQRNIGLCPQNSPIFRSMTVREQIEFFRDLKRNKENTVDDLLSKLQLNSVANNYTGKVCEIIKRKLCFAMAFVGGSKIVLLDEPTVGLSSITRFEMDDVIKLLKTNRTIILATPYMDEADFTGDHITIIENGRVACSGTPEFLKYRFETGYLLNLSFTPLVDGTKFESDLKKLIRSFVKNAELRSISSKEQTYLLPVESRSGFPTLFAFLETVSAQYGIDSFGVTLNSLEQIFLRAAEVAVIKGNGSKKSDTVKDCVNYLATDTTLTSSCFLWLRQLRMLVWKQILYYLRNTILLITELFLPLLIMASCLRMLDLDVTNEFVQLKKKQRAVVLDNENFASIYVSSESANESLPAMQNVAEIMQNHNVFRTKSIATNDSLISKPMFSDKNTLFGIGILSFADSELRTEAAVAYFRSNRGRGPFIATNIINNARLGNSTNAIIASVLPYKKVLYRSHLDYAKSITATSLPVIFYIVSNTAFSFVFSGYVFQLIDESRSNFKRQLLSTGINSFLYWASIFIGNFILYAITCMACMTLVSVLNWSVICSYKTGLVWVLQYWVYLPFLCCLPQNFSSSFKAYAFVMLYMTLLPFVYSPLVLLLVNNAISWYTYFFVLGHPSFAVALYFGYGQKFTLTETIISLLFAGIFNLILFYFICCHPRNNLLKYRVKKKDFEDAESDEMDVVDERNRVAVSSEYVLAIRLEGLAKWYGDLPALLPLTLGVDKDECFGLLGASGSGKSTLFNILTGLAKSDGGTATVNSFPVEKIQVFGYCPHSNPLLGCLTPRETLHLIVTLRGFADVKKRVETLLKALSLSEFGDVCVNTMRKGRFQIFFFVIASQQRLLSIGLAITTQTNVILLDEPTRGVDPKTRRLIWDILAALREQKYAIFLTSQSIKECELLCNRIGVLHEGKLVAVGTPAHITNKFAQGYELIFTLNSEHAKGGFAAIVARCFPNAILRTMENPAHMVWHIPRAADSRWSTLFSIAEELLAAEPSAINYSITQTILEEAFLNLS